MAKRDQKPDWSKASPPMNTGKGSAGSGDGRRTENPPAPQHERQGPKHEAFPEATEEEVAAAGPMPEETRDGRPAEEAVREQGSTQQPVVHGVSRSGGLSDAEQEEVEAEDQAMVDAQMEDEQEGEAEQKQASTDEGQEPAQPEQEQEEDQEDAGPRRISVWDFGDDDEEQAQAQSSGQASTEQIADTLDEMANTTTNRFDRLEEALQQLPDVLAEQIRRS